ncbi:DNA-binding protein OS=Streptomyces alboniger OX=132473 GN=CP975_02410 PE=4 SV=1 [Streptomyces alboniger]
MTDVMTTQPTTTTAASPSVALSGAARELGLKRGEFDLAVLLGRIRTVAEPVGTQRRVARTEIDRLRGSACFPEALRESVRVMGTTEAAELMDITTARFTRLARAGFLTPVKFYLNRYRAVVWLYLAEELLHFAESEVHSGLLTGRLPEPVRGRLDDGQDLRARNWRSRHVGFLLRQTEDSWQRVAAMASLLDQVQVTDIVKDPYERAYLDRLVPAPRPQGAPDSPTALIVERIMFADDPEELRWLRASLLLGLVQARSERPAPRPAPAPAAATGSGPARAEPKRRRDDTVDVPERDPRGLRKWLRRRQV